jgi:hypothetical protein
MDTAPRRPALIRYRVRDEEIVELLVDNLAAGWPARDEPVSIA